MPLDLNRYDVAIAHDGLDLDKALDAGEGDGYEVHRVVVLHADQLVAEQAAPRYGVAGLDVDNPQKMTWVTLWCWCALRRMRVQVPEFPAFKGRVLSIDGATDGVTDDTTDQPDAPPDVEALAVGPTGPPPDTDSP